jgi:hypothetical protein
VFSTQESPLLEGRNRVYSLLPNNFPRTAEKHLQDEGQHLSEGKPLNTALVPIHEEFAVKAQKLRLKSDSTSPTTA